MSNLSSKTRKELVLDALRAARDRGEGVMTAYLENAQVGGTAGTARVRDLRKDGYVIEARPHPAKDIDQYVYFLRSEPGDPAVEELPTGKPFGDTSVPYVHWRRGTGTSSTAHYNDHNLWVEQIVGQDWIWRCAPPHGTVRVDRAATEALAKRAAIVAALT